MVCREVLFQSQKEQRRQAEFRGVESTHWGFVVMPVERVYWNVRFSVVSPSVRFRSSSMALT